MRRGFEKGRCRLYGEEEHSLHTLLKCSGMRKWRGRFLDSKWLNINDCIACKRIINYTNSVELRNIGKCLYRISYKW
jgi:hypothetical protein